MKKIFTIILGIILLSSCDDAKIYDAVVVEQINVIDKPGDYKYEVKLKTGDSHSSSAYYYTNHRFQVSDTLYSYYEYFAGKQEEAITLRRERDSIAKELEISNYYLKILKERVLFDTSGKK